MTKQYEYQKKYRLTHPEYKRKWSKAGIKKQIRDKLGNKCFICGYSRLIHLHHKYKKKHKSDLKIKATGDYLLLCPNHHELLHAGLLNKEEIEILKKHYSEEEFKINFVTTISSS